MRLANNNSNSKNDNDDDYDDESTSNTNDSVQVACIITALSNNRNRTTKNVRHLVNKYGGEFLPTDHLNYLFHNVGQIAVKKKNNRQQPTTDNGDGDGDSDDLLFEEELMECALEAGAINIEPDDDEIDENEADGIAGASKNMFVVTTEERDLWKVVRALRREDDNDDTNDASATAAAAAGSAGFSILRFEHRYVLRKEYGTSDVANVQSDSEAREHLEEFLDRLDDDEDVHLVYHNAVLV